MEMISIPFAVSKGGKISEEEYLPGLLLEVEKNKRGGGLLKKSGETVTVTIKLQSRYETGVLDCIVTDEIPPQFELTGDMPAMIYQLNCNQSVEEGWSVCPFCGGKLK